MIYFLAFLDLSLSLFVCLSLLVSFCMYHLVFCFVDFFFFSFPFLLSPEIFFRFFLVLLFVNDLSLLFLPAFYYSAFPFLATACHSSLPIPFHGLSFLSRFSQLLTFSLSRLLSFFYLPSLFYCQTVFPLPLPRPVIPQPPDHFLPSAPHHRSGPRLSILRPSFTKPANGPLLGRPQGSGEGINNCRPGTHSSGISPPRSWFTSQVFPQRAYYAERTPRHELQEGRSLMPSRRLWIRMGKEIISSWARRCGIGGFDAQHRSCGVYDGV